MADEGFLGRWSRRKVEVRQGKAVEAQPEPQPLVDVQAEVPALQPSPQPSPASGRGSEDVVKVDEPPPPTLEEVELLTPASDFTRFVARGVPADVKNAAVKKLFADPHFNVMDRMDVYIDDYNKSDPIPESMLRKLVSAKFLGLFEEDEAATREVANDPTAQTVAQSQPAPEAVPERPHADPDLRLQQDDAAPGEDPGDIAP